MAAIDHKALLYGLLNSVFDAGAALLRHREAGVAQETKRDGTLVSHADRDAEKILLAGLAQVAPGIPVIAEEAVSAGQIPDFGEVAFLVDALDGTREFLSGSEHFTVNIGLVQAGVPVFGIVFSPVTGRLFATAEGGRPVQGRIDLATARPAALSSYRPTLTPIATSPIDPTRGVRVITSRSSRSQRTEDFISRFKIVTDLRMGSSIKFGMMAAGEADFYPRFGPTSQWDIAAGHAILAAAGGTVTTIDGKPFPYLDRALMAAAKEPFLNGPFVAWGRPEFAQWHFARDAASQGGR